MPTCSLHDVLECVGRSRSHGPFDTLYEGFDQIGRVLNERLGENDQFVSVLVEAVPVDAIMTQHDRLEETRLVIGQTQDTNTKRDIVENVHLGEIVILD
jgi:hypothetical protein